MLLGMMEEWKTIVDYPLYDCSNLGRIRNKQTRRILKGGKYSESNDGYITHAFKNSEGKIVSNSAHRLIAKTWIDNPENKQTVDHINRIRNDNRVSNLRWATPREQSQNQDISKRKKSERKIWKCDAKTGEPITLYNSGRLAAVDVSSCKDAYKNISACALGKQITAYGFKWKYEDVSEIEGEEWKLYKETGRSMYYVSNCGRIKNKERFIKPTDSNGYKTISISSSPLRVHRLVAELFIDNPNSRTIVNHKDGIKSNNKVDNLEWVTGSENTVHAINTGLMKNVKKVVNYNPNGDIIAIYVSCSEAARAHGLGQANVNKCCRGEVNECGSNKLLFKYLEDSDDIDKMIVNKIPSKKEQNSIHSTSRKVVFVYDRDDNLLEVCSSINEASRKYKVTVRTVESHIAGRIKFPWNQFYFR